jgi:hypothetical protein
MTSVIANLFSNFNDLTKNKSITDSATEYKAKKYDMNTLTPALSQGEKFKKYQKKIKKNLEKKIEYVNSKEGFQGLKQIESGIQLNPNGLTAQSMNIINNNNYSSQQQQTISNLQQEYQNTLSEYENLSAQVSGSTTGYLNRVNPNNPYLGKNINISGQGLFYVTKQGIAKMYPNDPSKWNVWFQTTGKNGCPSQQNIVQVNLPWDDSYAIPGTTIPTDPPLITGSEMTLGQTCGNEGTNVFVNSMINNPQTSYSGCYADNVSSPLMTFIGGAPPPPSGSLQNGNFSQPQIANDSYQYVNSSTTVPGWAFYAVLINNSTGWGYPIPYPSGSQAACIQGGGSFGQSFYLNIGTYTVSFSACGRPGYSGANNIIAFCGKTEIGSWQQMPEVMSFTPPTTSWQNYTTTFSLSYPGNYTFGFYGTINDPNNSTAIQNVQFSSTGTTSSSGSYTYEQCQNAAIDAGYQYFALQNVNPTTSQGYCGVSNDQPSITSLGPGQIPSSQVPLWASNTSGQTGNTATLNSQGALSVMNSGGQSVFSTDSANATPSNYLGCYNDCSQGRGLPTFLGSGETYDTCKSQAQAGNWSYFGIQYTQPNGTSECWVGNDIANGMKMGKATNCTTANGVPAGGGCSNAIYNTASPNSNYFLILQDDGNMVVYRGTGLNDIQGVIWATGTDNSKLQSANPKYAASNGKYGKNWISSGSTLAAGDWVGSNSGNMALIMQSDGNLVLYTFSMVENCQKMQDGKTGGGVGANALYNIGEVGVKSNMSQVAYIDQNSELHSYPSTNTQYSNTYSELSGNDSGGNDIPGAAFGNATVESCQTTCNNNPDCAGFSFSNNVCYPKTSSMYPNGEREINPNVNLYIRGKSPISTPIGVPSTVNNTDTISYQKYVNGGEIGNKYGLANATSTQKQELEQLQSKMNLLTSQINTLTGQFGSGSQQAESQSQMNVQGIQNYLQGLETTNNKIQGFGTNVDRILSDSDIVVLQKNYNYLFWSIIAAGTVLVTMNIVKK